MSDDIVWDIHCDTTMGHDIAMGTYYDVTIHNNVARILIYYITTLIMILLFS